MLRRRRPPAAAARWLPDVLRLFLAAFLQSRTAPAQKSNTYRGCSTAAGLHSSVLPPPLPQQLHPRLPVHCRCCPLTLTLPLPLRCWLQLPYLHPRLPQRHHLPLHSLAAIEDKPGDEHGNHRQPDGHTDDGPHPAGEACSGGGARSVAAVGMAAEDGRQTEDGSRYHEPSDSSRQLTRRAHVRVAVGTSSRSQRAR